MDNYQLQRRSTRRTRGKKRRINITSILCTVFSSLMHMSILLHRKSETVVEQLFHSIRFQRHAVKIDLSTSNKMADSLYEAKIEVTKSGKGWCRDFHFTCFSPLLFFCAIDVVFWLLASFAVVSLSISTLLCLFLLLLLLSSCLFFIVYLD